jgi:hypothetical protein
VVLVVVVVVVRVGIGEKRSRFHFQGICPVLRDSSVWHGFAPNLFLLVNVAIKSGHRHWLLLPCLAFIGFKNMLL